MDKRYWKIIQNVLKVKKKKKKIFSGFQSECDDDFFLPLFSKWTRFNIIKYKRTRIKYYANPY